MRSPGVIYRRYRQIRRKILYDKIGEATKCIHGNCHYGKILTYTDINQKEHSLLICNYNSLVDEGRIEVCTNPIMCNAYVNNTCREDVQKKLEEELLDPKNKRDKYPDLSILEWVLDKDLNDAIKNPGFLGKLIVGCIKFLESILKNIG